MTAMRNMINGLVGVALLIGGVVGATPGPAGAADVIGLRVTGRALYEDAAGDLQPVRHARVEVCDRDGPIPFECDLGTDHDAARGRTGADGRFELTFSGGDLLGDLPDVYVRVFARTPAGNVVLETGISVFEYCMATPPHENYDPGDEGFDFDVGDISPDDTVPCNFLSPTFADVDQEHAAWQQLQFLDEVHAVADDVIGTMPDVSILWPSSLNGVPFYLPPGQIRMVPGFEDDRLTLYHEYGHHVLFSFAESPIPDYNNDVCDETNPLRDLPLFGGHCFWREENGSIHWTEGFPNFWAELVRETTFPGSGPVPFGIDTDDDGEADANVTSEDPYLPDGTSPTPGGDRNQLVEAWTHIILRDLWDGGVDNHDSATDATGTRENDSADRVRFDFADLWDIVQTDPDPDDIFHNHPTTILEFHELLVAAHPERENRINAVFTENGIFRFGADLGVRDVTASTTTVRRGQSITVGDTTFNDADAAVATGELSRTSYRLEPAYEWMGEVNLGFRLVPSLDPGEELSGDRTALIPTSAVPGTYTLVACADGSHEIYESQPPGPDNTMVANCAEGPEITIENRAPVANAGGPYTFNEGAGGTLDASASSDPDGDTLVFRWSSSGGILDSPLTEPTVDLKTTVDDGTYTATVTVADQFGGSHSDTANVVVNNVPPAVDAGADVNVDEGATVSRTVTVTDPVDTSFSATVDWGAGPAGLGTVTSPFTVTRVFADDAVALVEVCVNDGDDTTCDSFEVNVANVAPALEEDPVVVSGTEGTTLSGAAGFGDPGTDSWVADITWGDGGVDHLDPLADRSVPLAHTYAQDGSYAGSVCVTDDDGGSDCASLQATIANAPPVITSLAVAQPVMALVETSLAAEFTDLGVLDSHTATIDWGDGTAVVPGTVTAPSATEPGAVTGSHTYATEGDYSVTVCVTDDDDTTCASQPLSVLSVEEAADLLIDELRSGGSTDPAVLAAIDALDGTIPHSNSGALDKMLAGAWVAAVGKLGEAVTALDGAATDESATQAVLTLVAEAIARQRLAEVEARGFTSKGALKQIGSIRANIDDGRALYLTGSYRPAIDKYKVATQSAVDLLRTR